MRYIIVLVREDGEVYFWNVNESAFLQVLTMSCINHTAEQAEEMVRSPHFLNIKNSPAFRGNVHIMPTSL